MHSNNDLMPENWKSSELSDFERAVNQFYIDNRASPLTLDAAKFGFHFRDKEVEALRAELAKPCPVCDCTREVTNA